MQTPTNRELLEQAERSSARAHEKADLALLISIGSPIGIVIGMSLAILFW